MTSFFDRSPKLYSGVYNNVKALQRREACTRCNGTGLITRHFPGNEDKPEWDADDQPCPDCAPG